MRYPLPGHSGQSPSQNQNQGSGVGVEDAPKDVAPPTPAPSPDPPPVIEPLPLGPLIFAGSLVVGAAEQLITRTADAYVANQNDQIKFDATMSVATVENAHKTGERKSTEQKHEEGEARKARDRGGEKADPKRRPPRNRTKPQGGRQWKGPWPPPPGTPWW